MCLFDVLVFIVAAPLYGFAPSLDGLGCGHWYPPVYLDQTNGEYLLSVVKEEV
jgi:hypothetical protein